MQAASRREGVITLCFLLSGFAGLLYETVWFRQFASVFGTSEAAIGAVLAGYMGGLALGAALAARWGHRLNRPVLAYGLLELGVAAGALLIPFGLQLAGLVRVWLCGDQPMPPDAGGVWEVAINTSLTFLLMGGSTTCMGATLPLLARDLEASGTVSVGTGRLARLYGWNTCGAVLGTLTTAFVILPQCSLQAAVLIGVGVNVLVFVLAVFGVSRSMPERQVRDEFVPQVTDANASDATLLPVLSLHLLTLLVAVSSLLAFAYEIAWTRLLSHVLGGSVYSFATMLSAFLIGITVGSWFVSRALSRGRSTESLLITAQVLTAIGTAGAFAVCGLLPTAARWFDAQSLWGGGLISLLVLLPSTLGIGMTLPVALEAAGGASRSTGQLFAASTLGAIAGSLLCGHWLLPVLGFQSLFVVGVSLNLGLALATKYWAQRRSLNDGAFDSVIRSTLLSRSNALVVGSAIVLLLIARPETLLRTSPLLTEPLVGRAVFLKVGTSSTVALIEQSGEFRLATNGLPESVIARKGSVSGSEAGLRWLTALPVLARPQAKSVLIVGLGGGGAVSGVPSSVDEIHAVELEPQIINALRKVSSMRLHDPLSDARLKIIHNDARAALALTNRRYDIIVSQPSHPWTAGASHIYTREFLQLARQRLIDDGVFLQWMDATFIDEPLLKSIGATLIDSFEHARLYQPHPGTLLFLASREPLDIEAQSQRTGEPWRSHPEKFQWLGLNDVNDVAAALCLDDVGLRAFCAGADINTDSRNRLAMHSLKGRSRGIGSRVTELVSDWDPLVTRNEQSSLISNLQLDAASVVRRLTRTQFVDRAQLVVGGLMNPSDQHKGRGLIAMAEGNPQAARQEFVNVLVARRTDAWARFKLLEPMLQMAGNPKAPREFVELVSMTQSAERAVVEAAKLYADRDYPMLKSLEGQLSLARPTDSYYAQALLFRGLWRSKVTNSERKKRLGLEAIELADRALAVESSLFGALVRLWASQSADEPAHYLESAAYVIDVLNRQPQAMSASNARRLAQQVLKELERLETAESTSRERIAEIRTMYQLMESTAEASAQRPSRDPQAEPSP